MEIILQISTLVGEDRTPVCAARMRGSVEGGRDTDFEVDG